MIIGATADKLIIFGNKSCSHGLCIGNYLLAISSKIFR